MSVIKNTNITVVSVSQKTTPFGAIKFLVEGMLPGMERPTKFFFFDKKKDGNNTKAYDEYMAMGVKLNDMAAIGYTETDREFVGKEGDTVKYTERKIISFESTAHA